MVCGSICYMDLWLLKNLVLCIFLVDRLIGLRCPEEEKCCNQIAVLYLETVLPLYTFTRQQVVFCEDVDYFKSGKKEIRKIWSFRVAS